jgi:hypothetical protein
MTEFAPERVAASVGRALWGEVSPELRSVRFKASGRNIVLRFTYEGDPGDDQREAMGVVGAEVAADFPDASITEEAITIASDSEVAYAERWQTAYARKESSLAR